MFRLSRYILLIMCFCSTQKTANVVLIVDWSADLCSSDLLAARVKVILRRAATGTRQHAPDSGSYGFAGWVLKTGERVLVDSDGVSVPLSTGEYNLLLALAQRPRQVLTRDQLLDLTQGREAAAFDRAIDNQVSRLRRKIEADAKIGRAHV